MTADLRDFTTAVLLDETEHWRLLFAEIDRTPADDAEVAANSRAYVVHRLRGLNDEVGRRQRLLRSPLSPPWPDVASHAAERDAIKARLPLLETIQAHIPWPVERRGRSWWCCCPLPAHDEETPSFHIDGAVWHCFGCQRGGDVFEFIRHLLSVDGFPRVLQIARAWAGMPEPKPVSRGPLRPSVQLR